MKNKAFAFLTILSILACSVHADGCGFWYDYGTDRYNPLTQKSQTASIDYANGKEELLISINTRLEGDKAVWIFPIPSEPGETDIDILKEFPEYYGDDVNSKAGYTIRGTTVPMLLSQAWLISGALMFWQMGVFSVGGSSGMVVDGSKDSGIRIHERVEKMGLATELVEARDENAFKKYMQEKELTIPEESLLVIKEYIGKDYSFVVSWITDVERYKKETEGEVLAVKITFPTDKLYYPLRLTSVYGKDRIPMTVYAKGYVTPNIYDNIEDSSTVKYYANDEGLKYTKTSIRSESERFTEDLWMERKAPSEILLADFIATNQLLTAIVLFAIYSVIASLLAGLIAYRRRVPAKKLALIGLTNFLTILGPIIATLYRIEAKGEDKSFRKKFLLIIAALIILPAAVFGPLVLTSVLGLNYDEYHILYNLYNIIFIFFGIFVLLLLLAYPLLSLILAALMIKKFKSKGVYVVLFSIFFIVITILGNWMMVALFPPEIHYMGASVTTGWSKIRPIRPSVAYLNDGTFEASFTNTIGTAINVTGVNVNETLSGENCKTVRIGGIDVSERQRNVPVEKGKSLGVYAECPPKNAGKPYDIVIETNYTASMAGITVTRRDNGHIKDWAIRY